MTKVNLGAPEVNEPTKVCETVGLKTSERPFKRLQIYQKRLKIQFKRRKFKQKVKNKEGHFLNVKHDLLKKKSNKIDPQVCLRIISGYESF